LMKTIQQENRRKLASIQKIVELKPIEGKDRIELATVLGWHVIVQKGLYNVGDLCVYCEPDSVMPERPEFEFLRDKKFRIRVMKMAGVISEGICFPLSILPDKQIPLAREGYDVTSVLGVVHYETLGDAEENSKPITKKDAEAANSFTKMLLKFPPTRFIGKAVLRHNRNARRKAERFPSFISKTDEPRIQTMPQVLNSNDLFIVREKLDGQSMTAYLVNKRTVFGGKRYHFGICSRNRNLLRGSHSSENYFKVADMFMLKEAMMLLAEIMGSPEWLAIQGEVVGPGIQSNPHKLDRLDFYVFNLITPNGRIPCHRGEVLLREVCLRWVPMLGVIAMPMTVENILSFATGYSALAPGELREGVVCRNYEKNISFKAISPEYLIKHGR
jgi:hypothetical protein